MQHNYYNVAFSIRLRRIIHSEHFEIKSTKLRKNWRNRVKTNYADGINKKLIKANPPKGGDAKPQV